MDDLKFEFKENYGVKIVVIVENSQVSVEERNFKHCHFGMSALSNPCYCSTAASFTTSLGLHRISPPPVIFSGEARIIEGSWSYHLDLLLK